MRARLNLIRAMLNDVTSQNGVTSAAPAATPKTSSKPIKVWLVDDNQSLRRTLADIFDTCDGLNCTATFHSPNAALSALASKPGPDVILLDIQMGEACGLDAIRPIKALSRSTQVLMLTTFFDSKDKKRALTDGASGFLLKSFPIQQILDSIQEASRNPVPHLKRSRVQKRVAGGDEAANPPRRQSRHRPWLVQCLSLMQARRT